MLPKSKQHGRSEGNDEPNLNVSKKPRRGDETEANDNQQPEEARTPSPDLMNQDDSYLADNEDNAFASSDSSSAEFANNDQDNTMDIVQHGANEVNQQVVQPQEVQVDVAGANDDQSTCPTCYQLLTPETSMITVCGHLCHVDCIAGRVECSRCGKSFSTMRFEEIIN